MEGVVDGVVVVNAGVNILDGLGVFRGAVIGGEVAELGEFRGSGGRFGIFRLGVSLVCMEAAYSCYFFGTVFLFVWAIFGARVILEEVFSFRR